MAGGHFATQTGADQGQRTVYQPKGENFWARTYGRNLWIYPGWPLDITAHRPELENAGYAFFARLDETPPPSLPTARRTSEFNWQGALL